MTEVAKTININIIADMERSTPDATFEFLPPTILDNKIVILPADDSRKTNFIDAGLSTEFVTDDYVVDNVRTVGINLTANIMLVDTDNDEYSIDDERLKNFGEIEISLDVNNDVDTEGYAMFVDPVIINDNAEVETEALVAEPEVKAAEVLTEAELEDEEGPEWVVHYDLNATNESLTEAEELEDSISDIIIAPDIETAVKYAEQNARVKAKEDPKWSDAEVVSIKKKNQ